MPLLIHAVFWWIVGLMAGTSQWHATSRSFSGGLDARSLATLLLLVAAVLLVRRVAYARAIDVPARGPVDGRFVALLLAVAGWLGSSAAIEGRTHCRAAMQASVTRDSTLVFEVEQVQRPARVTTGSAMLRGQARWTSRVGWQCVVPVQVRLAPAVSDVPTAGRPTTVKGRALMTVSGVRIDAARVITVHTSPDVTQTSAASPGQAMRRALIRWRAHVGDVIDQHFRSRAPLVRALLIADQQQIAPEIRDRYADAGLVHMLSVSGMHVAIIASALLTLGGLLRVPRRLLEPLAMSLVLGYVLLLGCPPPAVRSAVMLMVVSIGKQWQRPVHDWTALALGAVIPTIDPLVVTDLGWQLSVGGMAALVATRALLRRWRRHTRRPYETGVRAALWSLGARQGPSGWLVREIVTGVFATLLTAPIIAWTFGRLSLIAPLSNIVAGPLIGVLQPALFLALLWAVVVPTGAAGLLADATQPIMALFDALAEWCSRIPGAVVPVSLTLATAVAAGLAVALFVRATAARRLTPWLVASGAAVVAALWMPLTQRGSGQFELHVLDVGQGDALAMRTPRGRWILVDAGRRWDGGDAGRRTVIPYVRRLGGDVALFVLSHPHDDHAGGAASVVRALRPHVWWEPAFVSTSAGYREALRAIGETNTRWERVHPGRHFEIDGVAITVLAPDSLWTVAQHDANETSVMLRVNYGHHRFLLTGDAERNEEAWLVAHYGTGELAADVLKLGHHGSRTSSSPALLDVVSPRLAIASVGSGNRYGHPAPITLANLLVRDVPALRTDLEGVIVVRSDGRTLRAEAAGEHWIIPPRQGVR